MIEQTKLPFEFALIVLVGWILGCGFLISFLQKWSVVDSAYFVFISLTTIGLFPAISGYLLIPVISKTGLGDTTIEHKDVCLYFLLILIGLAIVSMCINILQLRLEILFSKIVRLIDSDFKQTLIGKKFIYL